MSVSAIGMHRYRCLHEMLFIYVQGEAQQAWLTVNSTSQFSFFEHTTRLSSIRQ